MYLICSFVYDCAGVHVCVSVCVSMCVCVCARALFYLAREKMNALNECSALKMSKLFKNPHKNGDTMPLGVQGIGYPRRK